MHALRLNVRWKGLATHCFSTLSQNSSLTPLRKASYPPPTINRCTAIKSFSEYIVSHIHYIQSFQVNFNTVLSLRLAPNRYAGSIPANATGNMSLKQETGCRLAGLEEFLIRRRVTTFRPISCVLGKTPVARHSRLVRPDNLSISRPSAAEIGDCGRARCTKHLGKCSPLPKLLQDSSILTDAYLN